MAFEKSYLALNPCGCFAGAVVNNTEHPREVAKDVASFVRYGCTVTLVDTEWIRTECDWKACANNPDCVRMPKPKKARVAKVAQEAMI